MKTIADLHIHSRFSVATSRNLVPGQLAHWAALKGIDLLGTGDCVHPGWLLELEETLEPAGGGFFRLKDSARMEGTRSVREVRFVLSGEISTIYRRDGKVRKVHHLCLFPDLLSVRALQSRLERVGNIASDGRPILGLDSRDLLAMLLESSPRAMLVPAHIWTPWFSVLGSMSGFDRIEDCYGDLSGEIFAVESGLSADPAMIDTCTFLDRYTVVSNSDAHSPEKLGREANILDRCDDYDALRETLRTGRGFDSTVEFFPEEGKYHCDGHRKCGVRMDPLETLGLGGICPSCGKPVTRGVMYRVAELADRDAGGGRRRPFRSITAMPDLLAEVMGHKSASSKKVRAEYLRLIDALGPEFRILLEAGPDEIAAAGGELLAEGVMRLREGRVIIDEGYDGEFGRIRVFEKGEVSAGGGLFGPGTSRPAAVKATVRFSIGEFKKLLARDVDAVDAAEKAAPRVRRGPGLGQAVAISHGNGPCMVVAGPGTGKTWVLVERILRLAAEEGRDRRSVTALTFSNRAAREIRERLAARGAAGACTAATFHSFGLSVLSSFAAEVGRREGFTIAGERRRGELLAGLGAAPKEIPRLLAEISARKEGSLQGPPPPLFDEYNRALERENAFDVDDLVWRVAELIGQGGEAADACAARCRSLLVDEFQDINPAQYRLVRLLAPRPDSDLFVIGDPDQAIYGFRGASAAYFDALAKDYPSIKRISLERSYRCPDAVLKAAGQAMRRAGALSGVASKAKVRVSRFPTDRSEAEWIARTVESATGGVRSFSMDSGMSDGRGTGASFADFGVLCRSSFMFAPLIEAFDNHGVAWQAAGREPFVRREPARTVIAAMESVYLGRAAEGLSQGMRDDIAAMIAKRDAVEDVVRFLMHVRGDNPGDLERLAALAAESGRDWEGFLRSAATRTASDDLDPRAQSVKLLTIHAAKGLEFETVFVPGCEAGIIPFTLFGDPGEEAMKEEERLFYVAVTRTVKELHLSHADRRQYRGRVLEAPRSPFIDRIEKDLAEFSVAERKKKAEGAGPEGDGQLDLFG